MMGEIMRGDGGAIPFQHEVRHACSRPAAGIARILEQLGRAALFILIQYGIGTVDSPELDRRIIERRCQVRRRQRGIDALDVARVGLLDDQLALRSALEFVADPAAGGRRFLESPLPVSTQGCGHPQCRCCRQTLRWAASDARHRRPGRRAPCETRSPWQQSHSKAARHRSQPEIHPGTPSAARTSAAQRAGDRS